MTESEMRKVSQTVSQYRLKGFGFLLANCSLSLVSEAASLVAKQPELNQLSFTAPPGSLVIQTKLLESLTQNKNLADLRLLNFDADDLVPDASFINALCTLVQNCDLLSVVKISLGQLKLNEKMIQNLLTIISKHEYLRRFSFNGESEIFWSVLSKTARTQLKNLYRELYPRVYRLEASKLVFVGDGRVGKSSTIRTLLGKDFVKNYESTVVLDLSSMGRIDDKEKVFSKVSGSNYLAYQSRLLLQQTLTYGNRPASKTTLVPSRYQFDFEDNIIDDVLNDDQSLAILMGKEVEDNTHEHLFQIYDFAGQEIFYSLHQLFLTNSGIHLLIFNMLNTKESDMNRVRFWMESLLLHAPDSMVIIVGTHLEALRQSANNDEVKLNHMIMEVNEKIIQTQVASSGVLKVVQNKHLCFFPLDNAKGPGSSEAKVIVESIIAAKSGAAGFDRSRLTLTVTVAQHFFMSTILQSATHMTKTDFYIKATESGFKSNEVDVMLERYVEQGLILYFPDLVGEADESENIVALSPKWLTSALARVIYDKSLHNQDITPSTELRDDYERYFKTGVLSKELLDFFWERYPKEKDFLLRCSLKMLILVRYMYNGREEYLVPSMMSKHPIDQIGARLVVPTEFHCGIFFTKYLPIGYFSRIVAICMELAQRSESTSRPILSGSICRIVIDAKFVISLVVNQANNMVNLRLESDQTGLPNLVGLTKEIIQKMKESGNISLVGVVLAKKRDEENRQLGVTISDLESPDEKREYLDYWTHQIVDVMRFYEFKVPKDIRPTESFDLFLSHAWGVNSQTHLEVVRIEKLLSDHGVRCWIDERYMGGNIDLDMINGLKMSSRHVIFLTNGLIERLNNRNNNVAKEFFMITHAKKRGIPVHLIALESHLTNRDNWPLYSPLLMNFGEGDIIDFSSSDAITKNMGSFLQLIRSTEQDKEVDGATRASVKERNKRCSVS